ncbi:MAG TPA: hypothetical protein VHE78_05645 [Gemmatimonadaceae bacterium]|nr:hypothetical protein [Gemmatimonadaceae bacterium]
MAIDRVESSLRNKGMAWIRSRSGFVRYKMLKRVSLLEEIVCALDRARIPHCVTGGFAYDAMRGALTRYHADVDFALLGEHAEAAFAALRARGLDVTSRTAHKAVVATGDLHADLFLWRDVGHGNVDMMLLTETGCIEVQMPRHFVTASESVELMGVRFQIPSKQYLVSVLPFIDHLDDRAFICSLETAAPPRFEESVGHVEINTRRFAFRAVSSDTQLQERPQ